MPFPVFRLSPNSLSMLQAEAKNSRVSITKKSKTSLNVVPKTEIVNEKFCNHRSTTTGFDLMVDQLFIHTELGRFLLFEFF